MAETLEELIIRIGADVADLKKGMKEAGTSIKGLEKTTQDSSKQMETAVSKAAKGMADTWSQAVAVATRALGALGIALSGQQLVQFGVDAVKAAAELGRFSDQAGLTVTQFQALAFALRDTGVSQSELSGQVATFARNLSDLRSGQGSFLEFLRNAAPDLVAQFRATRDTTEALDLLANVMNQLGDRQDRLRVAQAAGVEAMGRFRDAALNGAEGLRKAQEGFTGLSEEAVKRAQEIERRYNEMWGNLTRRWQQFVVETLSGPIETTTGRTLEELSARSEELGLRVITLSGQLATLQARMAQGAGGRGGEGMAAALVELNKQLAEAQSRLAQVNAAMNARQPQPDQTGGDRTLVNAREAMLQAQADLALFQEQLTGTRLLLTGLGEQWAGTAQGIMGWTQQLSLGWVTHAEIVEQAEARIRAASQTTAEYQRNITAFKLALYRQEQQGMLDTANAAASLIQQAWPGQKAAAIAAAVINTAVGVTKALSSGIPPWNIALAAITAAAGAVQIATIRSSNLAGGGSISVPSASVPSTPALASAAGGGGAVAGGGGATAPAAAAAAPPGWTLTIKGLDPAAIFTGAAVDGIIERINDAVQNGATLISTRNLRF
jgi:hypothetical protein